MFIFLIHLQCCRRKYFSLGFAYTTCYITSLLATILAYYFSLTYACCLAMFITVKVHLLGLSSFCLCICMSVLCKFGIAIGLFGCLMLHFWTFPFSLCHFASFRHCFPTYFFAEIPLVCLHIISAVSSHFITASVCVPECTHFEALHFLPAASDVRAAEARS